MRAVILAAGDGGRLGPHTQLLPKPLVPILGRPMIEYTLSALREAGIGEAIVVTGYRGDQVQAVLSQLNGTAPRLRFVANPRFHGGASLSLRAARGATADEPFLLTMSDHLLSPALVRALLAAAAPRDVSLVGADAAVHPAAYVEEATKLVRDEAGFVTAIGKHLPAWDALDSGAFVLAPSAWDAVLAAPEDCELSVICAELARRRQLRAADVSGHFWYDVDTADDLAAAAARVSEYRSVEVLERIRHG